METVVNFTGVFKSNLGPLEEQPALKPLSHLYSGSKSVLTLRLPTALRLYFRTPSTEAEVGRFLSLIQDS